MILIFIDLIFSVFGGKTLEENLKSVNQLDNLTDIREHDVPYHVRVSIDLQFHVGLWYDVTLLSGDSHPTIKQRKDLLERPVCFFNLTQ